MPKNTTNELGISFILPVYNVEPYLEKCLNSIERQTSSRWEAILVDDGSTDNSSTICKSFASRNSKFRYIRQANQGQGSARNNGLKLAEKNFVCFVDPDDWISEETTHTLLELMNASDADFANFGIEFVTSSGKIKRRIHKFKNRELTGKAIFHKALLDSEVYTSPCNKIYRTSFLKTNEIQFPHLRAYEDIFFSRKLSLHAKKCLFIENILYHALIRAESTTRTLTPQKITYANDVVFFERSAFISPDTPRSELEVFNAHILKFTTYMIFQAAFRVKTYSDYLTCVSAMHSASKPALLETPHAARYLSFKNRVMIYAAFNPKLTYWSAKLLRLLGYRPY